MFPCNNVSLYLGVAHVWRNDHIETLLCLGMPPCSTRDQTHKTPCGLISSMPASLSTRCRNLCCWVLKLNDWPRTSPAPFPVYRYPRCGEIINATGGIDFSQAKRCADVHKEDFVFMGYSMRTTRWRFVTRSPLKPSSVFVWRQRGLSDYVFMCLGTGTPSGRDGMEPRSNQFGCPRRLSRLLMHLLSFTTTPGMEDQLERQRSCTLRLQHLHISTHQCVSSVSTSHGLC